jgi:hypothetical protein
MSSPTTTLSPQASQAGLAVVTADAVGAAWTQLDVTNLRQSIPQFILAVAAVTHRYGLASATLATRQYTQARTASGVAGRLTIIPAPPASLSQVGQGVDWALQGLWSEQPDIASVKTLVNGVAEKLVLDTGRQTILSNVERDPKAHGWVRLTEPAPCAFCALLAIRGPVYRSDSSADFRAHDNCRCHAEPIFGPYEPSDQVREWQQLYRDSTTSGNSARTRRQWRAAFDAYQKTTEPPGAASQPPGGVP